MKLQVKEIVILLVVLSNNSFCQSSEQQYFRNGIFLHHSTGANIWSQSGATTSIPEQMQLYNSTHNLSGTNSVNMIEMGFPEEPWTNDWCRWDSILRGIDPYPAANISRFLPNYPIIVFKSCYPSSYLVGEGSSSDTNNLSLRTLYNYKYIWRRMARTMSTYPDNFFVIWTNSPMVRGAFPDQTTANTAGRLSDQFCRWAKDTLSKGLDSEIPIFPRNVYVFDFFHHLADEEGFIPDNLAARTDDSHPNGAATDIVAPRFVNEIFDAAIAYENPREATSIVISPQSDTIEEFLTAQLDVIIQYDDGTQGNTANWQSLNPSIASVSSSGQITGLQPGSVQIVARSGNLADTAEIVISGSTATVDSVRIISVTEELAVNGTMKMSATAFLNNGKELNVTDIGSWSSIDSNIVMVDSGVITARSVGKVTISFSYEGKTSDVSLSIIEEPPTIILVDFGSQNSANEFEITGWDQVIKDSYTDYLGIGPGGTGIITGSDGSYNYQGVQGDTRTFSSGEVITVYWHNGSQEEITFTPNISFTDPNRIDFDPPGEWYPMSTTTIPAGLNGKSEFVFTESTAGTYSLVNVNSNFDNRSELICDKIESSKNLNTVKQNRLQKTLIRTPQRKTRKLIKVNGNYNVPNFNETLDRNLQIHYYNLSGQNISSNFGHSLKNARKHVSQGVFVIKYQ